MHLPAVSKTSATAPDYRYDLPKFFGPRANLRTPLSVDPLLAPCGTIIQGSERGDCTYRCDHAGRADAPVDLNGEAFLGPFVCLVPELEIARIRGADRYVRGFA